MMKYLVEICCVIVVLVQSSSTQRLVQQLRQDTEENEENYATNSQPRMYTSDGSLVFETGSGGYNISFKTNTGGRVNLNDKDLTTLASQIIKNQGDIDDLKNSGGGTIPQDIIDQIQTNKDNIASSQDQINQHNTKIQTLESNYASLKSTVDGIVADLQDDDCSGNPCSHGGTCVDLYKSYLCQCPRQWQGPQCQADVNECSQLSLSGLGCQNGGTCVNTQGGFRCDCTPEYFGSFCTSGFNDCSDGSNKCMHGMCVDGSRDQPNVPNYSCVCEDGWQVVSTSDPACGLDVNECLDTPCSRNPQVQCFNTPGSFTCGQCPNGYIGNGIVCTDIDECATNNGGCSTNPAVSCINQPGTNMCGPCPAGYTGNGRSCTVQDPCSSSNGGCHPIATCSTNPAIGPSYVQCTCPPGYSGNGVGPNGCTLNPTDCTSSCQNGACLDNGGGWQTCICDPGWSGSSCDTNINECASAPCQNGGTCADAINGYTCTCANDFSGTNCQTQGGSCGAYYRQDSGAFSYPATIGQNYPNGASCAWVVEVQLGKIIQATFPVFDIEAGGSSCTNDFLQIHEGNSASGHSIGKYCGTTAPGNPLLSSHNMLYFWFNSNSQTVGQGFQVIWQTTDPVCGGDISGQTFGDISSPGYPGVYPNSRDCYWTIQVEPGNVVQILFGTLDIEDEMSCAKDFLELRNGLTETDDLLARYCGASTPSPVSTTSPGAWIYFHTDTSTNAGGFHMTWISQEVTGCGGYLTENDGIITSPNWPNSYELNTECFWQIHVETTGRITITFTDLDIEDHSTCNYDYVEVHDGSSETSPFVARYCGTEVPPAYTSSGNDLWIKFRSDVSQTGSGFRLTYTVACGGTFTAPTGTLTSPFYPLPYPEDKECFYVINQTPGYVITLTFNDFNLEHHSSCAFDYIEIRDGPSEDSPLLSTLCGNSVPIPIESSTNYMWIHFYSDMSVTGSGFSASYTTHYTGCGGVYTEQVGTFTSPGQPVPYPNGANCTYVIAVDPSLIINLYFIQFSLEEPGSSGCYDYIEIFDGEGLSSPSLGRYCGSIPPPALTSTSYELTVYFTADQSITTDGFVVSYTTANASLACGNRITDSEGYITSPQYPNNYLPSRTCVWTIQVDPNMQIRVNFTDFALEAAGSNDGTCIYDYLELRNGGYEDSALIGTYCGTDSPGIFVSHGNQLYIKLHTDPYTEERGFLMFYDGSVRGCGGTLTSSNGYIESPNYPYPYAHNAECYWLIQVSQGSAVSLQFNTFDLETHGYCSYDYVEVYDGPSPGYPMLKRICGTQIPQQFQSSDNSMMIKFKSDANTAGSGFTAFYTTICDRTISGKPSGVIQSLDYPDNYPTNLDCTWHIQGTYGNKINVSVNYFAMETCDDCGCDYLQIHDGADTSSGSDIGKFCGGTSPPSFIQSSSNDLLFNFHTDPYISAPGFEIIWAVDGCGSTYTDSSGTLTSPNYPNNYPNSKECIWQIITSPGTSVKLTISVFDVEHHTTCDYDVLEVYNGLSTDSNNRLAQLCNVPNSQPNLPLVVSSTSTFMTVRFITDSSVNGRGFSATWEEQAGLCGGAFAASSGTITSPNYPNNYPANEDCEWYIDVGEGSTVILEFETFDTEPETGCAFDYVAVHAGNSTSDPLLLKACGSAIPDSIQSPSHNIFVQFHSDPYSTHTGFKANFRSGCGGYLIASADGAVTSPNYPDQYPSDTNCTWSILAPDIDGHVTLTLTHLDLYYNPDTNETACGNYDYLEIRDGPTSTSPTQGLYCGQTIPAPITSFSEALTVTMVSKSSYQASGFRALYTSATSRCGGDLTGRKGYFNSPGFPGPYPTFASCVWIIQSSPGNGVHLQFLSFSLQSHSSCYYDYLEVREGSETGPVLAKLCGSELPSNLTSVNGHILYIKFQSDASISGNGFQAYYEHVYGSTIIGQPNGTIASPMYPSFYPNYVDAKYYIYADFGNFISYQFQMFDLEQPASAGCIYDYLAIYDGDDVTSLPLMVSCGNAYQYGGQTSQDTMLVFFHSDWGLASRGFLMSWEQIEGGGIPPDPTNVPTIPPGQCGAAQMVATVHPIYFQSPGWPIRYDHNLQCVWHIDAAENYAISALILEMELEGSEPTCVYDYVRFYNGESENDPLISQHCGRPTNLPISVIALSNHMTIKLRTDSSVFYKGFNISYQQACGGLIQADLGIISTPMYPDNYPVDTECYWEIISTIGSTLLVDIDPTFNIQNSDISTCNGTNGDFLQLLNGRDFDSPPLTPNNGEGNGFYCGTTPPQNLQTQSNGLFVTFKSDTSGSGAGFSLTFSANRGTCGSLLTLTDQVTSSSFFSPDYPSTYPNGADCYWVITVPTNEAVQLDFTEFNVENHQSCVYDYVRVIDGRYDDGEILGIFCGTDIPPTTRSTGNEMTVHFRSDPSVQQGGFKADYSIATCGGTIVGVEGQILSPEYPNSYPSGSICEWRIRGPVYHYISLIFNDLQLNQLADGASCGDDSGDFIEFRTNNFTGPLLSVVCGSNPPLNAIETPDNEAFIRFVSDASGTSTGFNITFMASEDECGGVLTGPGGTLQTPNYPNAYDHARVCTWLITVADDRKVSLEFNAFDVEGSSGGVCYYDYVEIFNGINDNSPSLAGKFCGTELPGPVFESSGNTMKVVFGTDSSVSNGGFLATYTSTHDRVCGGRITGADGGSFNSPNYPAPYGPNQECVWILENTNPSNSTIRLSFNSFSLEDHVTCDYDYLSIRSGSTYQSPMIKKLCGTTVPADVGTAYGEMFVQFVSDPYAHDLGFQASFEFTPCGGYISGQSGGVLTSPNYPQPYNDHDYCLWTIAVAPGERVDLVWTDFELELHNNCLYDYLKLFNGPTTDSPLIGTYCGTTQPTQFQSGGNFITLLFQSDFVVTRGGWRAEWSTHTSGCGNVLYHDDTGTLTSPNFPDNYPHNSDCVWQILGKPSYHIEVTFDLDSFDVEYSGTCRYDYVALYDGAYEVSTLNFAQYCGDSSDPNAPPSTPISSSAQDLTVRFRTDSSIYGTGFTMNWATVCGQRLSAEQGTIQSPNYPAAYNLNERCEFLITYSQASEKFIKLTFDALSLEPGSSGTICNYDYVNVYGGNTTSAALIGSFCGYNVPTTPITSQGTMLVVFNSDPVIVDLGFQATYESSDCGGLLTDSTGTINAYTHSDIHNNRNCTWQIQVSPDEKIVQLKFATFDLETSSNCIYDYVSIYDGIDTSAPLIGKFCGSNVDEFIHSTSNSLTIEYVTDDLTTGDGFTAAYKAQTGPQEGCGGILTDASGTFQNPDLDNDGKYDPDSHCVWRIQANPNSVVNLHFNSFRLENESSPGVCIFDQLEIRDGSSYADPLALVACGYIVPADFISSGSEATVRFVSDPYIEDTGFEIQYSTQPQTCGGSYAATENFQIITSPVLDSQSTGLNCRWILNAGDDNSKFIEVQFDSLNVENSENPSDDCPAAYVEIRDFPLGDNGQVRRYCGSQIPDNFVSFQQVVQINLYTDASTTGAGFTLRYKLTSCSRSITLANGQLFSPGWPDPYAQNLNCEITIEAPAGNRLMIFFSFFDVEFQNNCDYDHLVIRDGLDSSSTLLAQLCGNYLPDPVFPSANQAYINFLTDPYTEGAGYDVTFTSSPGGNGGNFTGGDHGVVQNFMYPQPYEPNLDAEYSIRTPYGRPVTVHITLIDLFVNCTTGSCFCQGDTLTIYGGPTHDDPRIGGWCGYGTLTDLQSPTNGALLRLRTSDFEIGSRTNTGFRIDYES